MREESLFDCELNSTCQSDVEHEELILLFENLYEDSSIKISTIAKQYGCSERTFRRKCKRYFNKAPNEILIEMRLVKAIQLLEGGMMSSHVWHQVGFSSHSYFSDVFKAKFNMAPSEMKSSM